MGDRGGHDFRIRAATGGGHRSGLGAGGHGSWFRCWPIGARRPGFAATPSCAFRSRVGRCRGGWLRTSRCASLRPAARRRPSPSPPAEATPRRTGCVAVAGSDVGAAAPQNRVILSFWPTGSRSQRAGFAEAQTTCFLETGRASRRGGCPTRARRARTALEPVASSDADHAMHGSASRHLSVRL